MMNELPRTEKRVGSVEVLKQVQDFIKGMWNHELLDEEMIRHRSQGKGKFEQFLQGQKFDQQYFFGLLAGSSLVVTDETSDYDYFVCGSREKLCARFFYKVHSILEAEEAQPKQTGISDERGKLAFVDSECFTLADEFDMLKEDELSDRFAALLITPDEFVAGNLKLAQRTRLKIIRTLNAMENWKRVTVWKQLKTYITKNYCGWMNENYWGDVDKRRTRFTTVLAKRFLDEESRRKFLMKFRTYDKHLPTFEAYSQAMKKSKGALSIVLEN